MGTALLKRAAVLLASLAIPALLLLLCLPRLGGDFGMMRAKPAVMAALVERKLPAGEYAAAADALKSTYFSNGDALINRAEMVALQSSARANLLLARELVVEGLTHSPVEPRGWTLLCEIDFHLDARQGAHCMETGLFIAPFDWFSAGRRSVLAANLYPFLSLDTQAAAARRVRLMWYSDNWPDHSVRRSLFAVYNSPYGPALLQAAFREDKPGLRDMNLWLIHWRMYGPQG